MDYLKESLKATVESGSFGPVTFVSSSLTNEIVEGSSFISSINFCNLVVNTGTGKENHSVVVKMQPRLAKTRELLLSDESFKNEIISYKEILPLLNASKISVFPKFYYGNYCGGQEFEKDILIFENLTESGYVVAREKIFLNYNHITLALKKLGEFHALSLIAKKENPEKFHEMCSRLSKSKFESENMLMTFHFELSLRRGINPIYDKNIERESLGKFMEEIKNFKSVAEKIFKPEEPFSVYCHGDFNKNNILYKYDDSEIPVDIKFFDLQNGRYTSPAIDISFLLYMNTLKEDRHKYWEEYLQAYWKGLLSVLPDPGFSFEEFHKHFAKRAIYGYFPCSFFIPAKMSEENFNVDGIVNMNEEEMRQHSLSCGGEKATEIISDIVQHLLDRNYLKAYFEL